MRKVLVSCLACMILLREQRSCNRIVVGVDDHNMLVAIVVKMHSTSASSLLTRPFSQFQLRNHVPQDGHGRIRSELTSPLNGTC